MKLIILIFIAGLMVLSYRAGVQVASKPCVSHDELLKEYWKACSKPSEECDKVMRQWYGSR